MRKFIDDFREHWDNRSVLWEDFQAGCKELPERWRNSDTGAKATIGIVAGVCIAMILMVLI